MCLAVPGKIKEIKGRQTLVEYPDSITTALIGEKSVKAGDYVMVQMGIIIKIISKNEAALVLSSWREAVAQNSKSLEVI